jgi:hypothetical protein
VATSRFVACGNLCRRTSSLPTPQGSNAEVADAQTRLAHGGPKACVSGSRSRCPHQIKHLRVISGRQNGDSPGLEQATRECAFLAFKRSNSERDSERSAFDAQGSGRRTGLREFERRGSPCPGRMSVTESAATPERKSPRKMGAGRERRNQCLL